LFKEAGPSLTNAFADPWAMKCLLQLGRGVVGRLNFYSFPRQPAITRLGRFVTSTQRSSHSFATETGWPFNRLSRSSSSSFGVKN